jgi:hypothetical protein
MEKEERKGKEGRKERTRGPHSSSPPCWNNAPFPAPNRAARFAAAPYQTCGPNTQLAKIFQCKICSQNMRLARVFQFKICSYQRYSSAKYSVRICS